MDTSLHLALCDSDPGDRKQMERLLGRESDKRVNTTGVFYIETFGSAEGIINAPMVYDAYFMDATDEVCNSYDIAVALREKGILSPIVFCISTIDYHKSGELLPNSVFMNKPILVSELSLVLDEIIKQKRDNYIPTIELRNNYDTFYVEEKDVIYFQGSGRNIEAHMTDGGIKTTTTFLDSLYNDVLGYKVFCKSNKNTIINVRHLSSVSLMSVTMDDGTVIKCSLSMMSAIKDRYALYQDSQNS